MSATTRLDKLWVPGLAVLALLVTFGCARTPQQKESRFLDNGKKYMQRKDYARAVLQFRNALQVTPGDAEAHFQLGLAELAGGQLGEAVQAFRKAVDLDPGHGGAQVKLAELMALSGIDDIVKEGRKRMQGVLRTDPGNLDALNALALSEFQLGNWEDAQAHLEEALEKFPQSVKSAVSLAKIDLAQRDFKGAGEVLRKGVRDAPQSTEAAVALGQVYMLDGRWSDAEGQFQAALRINPNLAGGLIGLASAQLRQGRLDQAEQTYRKVSALPEKEYRHLYAAFLFDQGKRDAAIREFERLSRQSPGDRDARTRLVAAYLVTNRVQDAERVLTIALQTNRKDFEALLQRSQILLRAGKQREAENDLSQVLHDQPDSARGHYLLARVYRDRGDSLRQREELGVAVRLDPAFLAARIEQAQCFLQANSARAALDVLDKASSQQKNILAFVIQRNWTLLALDEQAEARSWVNRGLAMMRVPDLLIQDSILKLKQRDFTGARASALEVLQHNPEDVRALRAVAATYVAQKEPAAALRTLQEHAAHHPKSAAVQQFVGEWFMANRQPAQAREAFSAARAVNPNSVPVNVALAQLDISAGKLDEARELLTGLLSSDNAGAEPHLWLGSIEVKAGNYPAAMEHFRKVLESDNKNVLALNNLAYLLTSFANQPDEALALAQQAHEAAPDNADTEGTLGWVLYRKGLYDTALKYMREAVAKDGDGSSLNAAIRKYHLALVYQKLGDRQSSSRAMTSALKINPNLMEAKLVN